MSNQKAVVTFQNVQGWTDLGERGTCACLTGINGHPTLGNPQWVRTSLVVGVKRNDTDEVIEIETLNTIYRRA